MVSLYRMSCNHTFFLPLVVSWSFPLATVATDSLIRDVDVYVFMFIDTIYSLLQYVYNRNEIELNKIEVKPNRMC